jgi:uncharacterized protein (DUF58 family)
MKWFHKIYLTNFFFYILAGFVGGFVLSFVFPAMYNVMWFIFYIYLSFTLLDVLLVFAAGNIDANRTTPEKFSNGDENPMVITVNNSYSFAVKVRIIDEVPFQFQLRNFTIYRNIEAGKTISTEYTLRPVDRGEYHFGKLNVYASSPLQLISRRFVFDEGRMVPAYPSYLQLKKYGLIAFTNRLFDHGLKKIRRLGHTMEFEQIKDYTPGDDLRTINWNATARRNKLMVNQFQDERSQNIYMAIDKGRMMKMPFGGLSLLDYAINASLVLSDIVLKKGDKAGLFAFSKQITNRVAAERRQAQMQKIMESLYNVSTDYFESDYGRLYADIKRNLTQRSLILLYTNFETLDGLHRQLPYLKGIAKSHLLVVIFFDNTELNTFIKQKAATVQEIYDKAVAEKFAYEKRLIVNELSKYAIHSVLTQPENLTIDTINEYLEIKSRGMI